MFGLYCIINDFRVCFDADLKYINFVVGEYVTYAYLEVRPK